MGAGAGPFADEAYLPVALKNPELRVVEVKVWSSWRAVSSTSVRVMSAADICFPLN